MAEKQPGGAATGEETVTEEEVFQGPRVKIERKRTLTVPTLVQKTQQAIAAMPPSEQSLVRTLQAALNTSVLSTRAVKVTSLVYRLSQTQPLGIGAKIFVDKPNTEGYMLSVALLSEDPNLEIQLWLDDENYGASIADLIQRQQAFLTATDWTITRQDANVTPPQYAIAVFPSPAAWSWNDRLRITLNVPASLAQIGVRSINVDQLVVKWVEY